MLLQVNFGSNSATLLGIGLIFFCISLFIFQHKKYNYDFVLSPIIGLSGAILVFQAWRLDPILQFVYLILVITTVFYFFEDI
ncbi:MAG: Ycf66 family protein, partial [Dolichospermum sp.]